MELKRSHLIRYGFHGFKKVCDLMEGMTEMVSDCGGIYMVLREIDTQPRFLYNSSAGWFKGKNPTKDKRCLLKKWVPGAHVIYIGKGDNLQERIDELLKFGMGKSNPHWGGRLIWQIEDSQNFLMAWKEVKPGERPRDLEYHFIRLFFERYKRLPFANWRR